MMNLSSLALMDASRLTGMSPDSCQLLHAVRCCRSLSDRLALLCGPAPWSLPVTDLFPSCTAGRYPGSFTEDCGVVGPAPQQHRPAPARPPSDGPSASAAPDIHTHGTRPRSAGSPLAPAGINHTGSDRTQGTALYHVSDRSCLSFYSSVLLICLTFGHFVPTVILTTPPVFLSQISEKRRALHASISHSSRKFQPKVISGQVTRSVDVTLPI